MTPGNRRVLVGLLLLAAVAAGAVGAHLLGPASGSTESGAFERAQARSHLVERAAAVGIPGSHFLAVESPSQIFGDETGAGATVTIVNVRRRRLDLSEVPMDDRRGGVVKAMLALAQARGEVLAEGHFDAMRTEWVGLSDAWRERIAAPADDSDDIDGIPPPWVQPPGTPRLKPIVRLRVGYQSDSGGGGGETHLGLNLPRIAHYVLYVVPKSGATLFVRDVLDQRTMILESEFSYSDRTLFGVEYPTGSYIVGREPGGYLVHEEILEPK
jgi:hypothetical protein